MPLYDYLYVDLPKVISLYSQITGGVVESRESTQENSRSAETSGTTISKFFDTMRVESRTTSKKSRKSSSHTILYLLN
jgi:hypothetical protein